MDRNYSLKYSLLTDNAKTNDSIRLEVAKADLKIKLGTIQRTFGAAVPDFNDVGNSERVYHLYRFQTG